MPSMEDIKESGSEESKPVLKIAFEIGDDIKTIYANELAVQTLYSEVILSFFEVRLPVQVLEGVESEPKAHCVGRIAMPLGKVPAVIEALDSQFSTYLEKISAIKKSKGDINGDDGIRSE